MVIRNQSCYPTDEVRALVKFGIGRVEAKDVLVLVKHTQNAHRVRFSGTAYASVQARPHPKSCRYQISLRLGLPRAYEREAGPWRYGGSESRRYPQLEVVGWKETLVMLAAHEAKHIDQFRLRRKRHSEVACEHYAKFMVEQYRAKGV